MNFLIGLVVIVVMLLTIATFAYGWVKFVVNTFRMIRNKKAIHGAFGMYVRINPLSLLMLSSHLNDRGRVARSEALRGLGILAVSGMIGIIIVVNFGR